MDVLAVYHKEMKQAAWSNVKGFMALSANVVLPLPPLCRQPGGWNDAYLYTFITGTRLESPESHKKAISAPGSISPALY